MRVSMSCFIIYWSHARRIWSCSSNVSYVSLTRFRFASSCVENWKECWIDKELMWFMSSDHRLVSFQSLISQRWGKTSFVRRKRRQKRGERRRSLLRHRSLRRWVCSWGHRMICTSDTLLEFLSDWIWMIHRERVERIFLSLTEFCFWHWLKWNQLQNPKRIDASCNYLSFIMYI
jgi:hypothetical protein